MGLSHSRNDSKIIKNNIEKPLLTRINDTPDTIEVSTDLIDADNNVSTDVIDVDRSLHDWSFYVNHEEVIWLI